MKPLLTILFVLSVSTSFAQRQNVYYLKSNGRYVDSKDSADVIRVLTEPDKGTELYNVSEFYKSGPRKLVGKSSTIDPPKFEGIVVSSYEVGSRKAVNNYVKGVLTGEQYEFYKNGKTKTITNYTGKKDGFGLIEFTLTAAYDSLDNTLVNEGLGYYKGYDLFVQNEYQEGPIKNGKRDGEWKYNDSLYTATELFDNGKFISGSSVKKKSGLTTTYTVPQTLPTFNGDPLGFGRYIGRSVRYPQIDREKGLQGTVLIHFIIEKDGKVSHVEVLRSATPAMDSESVRVISNSPLWSPGMQFGRSVRAEYTIPISFTLGYSH